MALVSAPPGINEAQPSLDASWLVGIQLAFLRHFQWGTQIVWTYGPYGFLSSVIYVDFGGWLATLIASWIVHLAFVASLAWFLAERRAPLWAWLVLAGVLLLLQIAMPNLEYDSLLAALLLLHLAATSSARLSVAAAPAAGALLGFVLSVRGTGLVGALGLTVGFAAICVILRRPWRVAALLAGLVLTFGVLWVAAGQDPRQVPAYLARSYQIISGYSSAMAFLYGFPLPRVWVYVQLALAWAVMAAAGLVALYAVWRRSWDLFGFQLLSLPLLFLMYKEAYVRFGDRAWIFYTFVALTQLPALVLATTDGERRWQAWAPPAALSVLAIAVLAGLAGGVWNLPAHPTAVGAVGERLAEYRTATRLILKPSARTGEERAVRGRFQAADGYPPEVVTVLRSGTADVFPADVGAVYAYDLDWDPMPVIQAYQAYTPALDAIDAAHVRDRPAGAVILQLQSVDGRYPPFDEPATFRALLDGYRPLATGGDYVLATSLPSRPARHDLGSVDAGLGQEIPVPAAPGRVYAEVEVKQSLLGRLAELLFQPSPMSVRLKTAQEQREYRFIPGTAPDGLLVSSLLTNPDDLARVMDGHTVNPIQSFTVLARRPSEFGQRVRVTFYSEG